VPYSYRTNPQIRQLSSGTVASVPVVNKTI
jgi:hypothetical protein